MYQDTHTVPLQTMQGINVVALVMHALAALACVIMHFACGFAMDTYQDLAEAPRWHYNATIGLSLGEELDESCYDTLNENRDRSCIGQGLPLYQDIGAFTRWHPIALLGHFEFVSTAFSLFHVLPRAWRACAGLALLGAMLFVPYSSGSAGLAEFFAMVAGSIAAASIFVSLRQWLELDSSTRVALRYAEYTITAPELFVAVLCIFIVEPPAFMPLTGLVLIGMCNLGGLQMHWALVAACEPDSPPTDAERRAIRVPASWLARTPPLKRDREAQGEECNKSFGLVECGLLDTWCLYAMAMLIIAYQGQLLLLSAPPWYVTASAWFLLISYTSFGVWATMCYTLGWGDVALDAGFAVLSPVAKVGIVGMLAFAFAFQSACLAR